MDPWQFIPSMISVIVFYFTSAPAMRMMSGADPLSPERIAQRRAAVLDFISAALFRNRIRFQRSTLVSVRNKVCHFLAVIFLVALGYYLFFTPSSKELVLIGTVDSNQVIVSPQVPGELLSCWWMKARK